MICKCRYCGVDYDSDKPNSSPWPGYCRSQCFYAKARLVKPDIGPFENTYQVLKGANLLGHVPKEQSKCQ